MFRRLGWLVLAVVLAAGCDSGASGTLAPTTTAAVVTTTSTVASTTTTLVPLSVIPPVIDVAYAQRVMDELAKIDGEAALEIYTQRKVTQRFLDLTSAVQERTLLEKYRQEVFEADIARNFKGWRNPPGPGKYVVLEVLAARCGPCLHGVAHVLGPRRSFHDRG